MPPLAPNLQRRQRKLPIEPAPVTRSGLKATRKECEELYLYLLSRRALGWKQAMRRDEVRAGFSKVVNRITDRKLQAIMAMAPLHGIPLASSSSAGYYVITTIEDALLCIDELQSRIDEHTLRAKALDAILERIRHGDTTKEAVSGDSQGS